MRATLRWIPARRGAVVLGILITISKPVVAQTPARTPIAGDRVRITRLGFREPVVGSLVSATADSIAIVPMGPRSQDIATIARTTVQALEVSDGRHRHPWTGLAFGLSGGAAVGAIIGAVSYKPCHPTEFLGCFLVPASREESALFEATVFGGLGAMAGLLVGTLYQTDDWHPVTLERVVQLRLGPTSHGVAASVSLSLP